MKLYLCVILALALSVGLVLPAFGGASVTSSYYQVSEKRYQYWYHVNLYPQTGSTIDMGLTQFAIATWKRNWDDYSNWSMPAGWSAALVLNASNGIQNTRTQSPEGEVYTGTVYDGPNMLVWSGPSYGGYGSLDFGFESSGQPWNVGWAADGWETFWQSYDPEQPPVQSQMGFGSTANWASAVNWGYGPIYGPAPEPGSLIVLGSGMLALAGMMLRRRR